MPEGGRALPASLVTHPVNSVQRRTGWEQVEKLLDFVPWAPVLWSVLNDFWEAGARASSFFRSGSLGWPLLVLL